MIKVSSYRRLFEEQRWSQAAGPCSLQAFSASRIDDLADKCPALDFAAARALNKEGVAQFVQERSVIAALNDRLVGLIDVFRCLEEENESLEAEILEFKNRRGSEQKSSSGGIQGPEEYSLEAAIEKLQNDKEDVVSHTEELRGEVRYLQMKCQELLEERTLVQEEREQVSLEVDAITTDCLALREQAAIYQDQLATMKQQHEATVEQMCEDRPEHEGSPTVSLQFPAINGTPAIMAIKEYYSELAESLKFESRSMSAGSRDAAGKTEVEKLEKTRGGKAKDVTKETDVNTLKSLIAELQKKADELETQGDELEAESEGRKSKYLEEIEELENYISQLEEEEADLQFQMKELSGDGEELLIQKMNLDIEIAAYRGLVADEEERLGCL